MPEPTVFNGRYELHRRLGRGGMAEVFLARDLQLDRPVAVKVLFTEFAGDPAFVTRFRREAQAAANLNHPNIVGVYDWGQEHGTYFIVMEYVDGRSLADMLRADGPFTPERAADIATDVAAALGAAHRAGVLHRDIKPGNILVTDAGSVKVADWGIGRAMDAAAEENLTQTGAVMGTATYFSPEQAQGLPLDPRSDLYSLGVVLYELLTGRPPFQGDSPVAIAYKHVQEKPRPPRSVNLAVPPALEAIVLQLLEKRPEDRYASADDLRADLRRYLEGFEVRAATRAAELAAAPIAPVAATTAVPAVPHTQAVLVYAGDGDYVPVQDVGRRYAPPPERRSGWFLVVLVILLAVLAALLFLLARTLGVGQDNGPSVTQVAVPPVVGQTQDAATQILQGEGFTVHVDNTQVDDAAQVGLVITQDPEDGRKVDEGSSVTITVGAQNLLEMPDLTGSTPDLAAQQLQALGFTGAVNQTQEASADVDAGNIIRTDPVGGTQVAPDIAISLVVSSGPAPVMVPSVATLAESDAVAAVEAAGLAPHVVQEASDTVDSGRVIRTDPASGTSVQPGSTVNIVVSSGPDTDTVPAVVGLDEDAAKQALQSAGFTVAVVHQSVGAGDPDDGKVTAQTPGGNTQAPPGSTVTITVAEAAAADTTTTTTSTTTP